MKNLKTKDSIYFAIISTAILEGIFLGIYLKIGINASISGIGLQIIDSLQSWIPENMMWQIEIFKTLITILPIILIVGLILSAPNKIYGIIIFVSVMTGMILFIIFS